VEDRRGRDGRVEEERWERDAPMEIEMREEAAMVEVRREGTVMQRWGWKGRMVLVEAWRGWADRVGREKPRLQEIRSGSRVSSVDPCNAAATWRSHIDFVHHIGRFL
jgi:hypothetical protein